MSLLDRLVLGTLPIVPRFIMRRMAGRYIAGETLEEALERLSSLRERGFQGVLDILGEDVESEEESRRVAQAYKDAASALKSRDLDCYVSVKPTHFGLRGSIDLAHELYSDLLRHCRERGQFVRVEMEDHTTTTQTLELFARLHAEFDNVGIVLQSRLKRTPADIEALPSPPVDVRMVKGIYLEPEEIGLTDAQEIRDAFVQQCEQLFRAGHTVAIATHDEHMAARVLRSAADLGVSPERAYFEVLLGVQQKLWQRWLKSDHAVRVYVPFGPDWRAYAMRRMRKNPEILRHVLRATLRLGG